MNDTVIHVYGPFSWHDDAHIVANREGLEAMRNAIDQALKNGEGNTDAFVNDGEGFTLYVTLHDGELYSPEWDALAVPYTGAFALEKRKDAVRPPFHSALSEEDRNE